MGLYDREYYQDDQQGSFVGGGAQSMVVMLIVINVAVYLVDFMSGGELQRYGALQPSALSHPWQLYQLLTYGFLHDSHSLGHILWNMIGLFIFGRDMETIYGPKEFLRLYLSLVVLSGLTWLVSAALGGASSPLIGASGGVFGIMVLYALHYPFRTFLLMLFIPVPAWLLIGVYVVAEIFAVQSGDRVAHICHLGGAGFAWLYYSTGWNLGRWLPQRLSWSMFRRRPKLRVHTPERTSGRASDQELQQRVDEILEKISLKGEASLTKEERRTLEDASRRYQQRRR